MSDKFKGQLTLFNDAVISPIKKSTSSWIIYVDGASRGNPGPSGAGIYIYNKTEEKVLGKEGFYLGKKTNNQAEYLALVLASIMLRTLIKDAGNQAVSVLIVSDSELLIKQMQGFYRVKNPALQELKERIDSLLFGIHHNFKHVLRERNIMADALANQGVDHKKLIPFSFREQLKNVNLSLP